MGLALTMRQAGVVPPNIVVPTGEGGVSLELATDTLHSMLIVDRCGNSAEWIEVEDGKVTDSSQIHAHQIGF